MEKKRENMLDGIMESELEKTSSFKDIMSRSERKKLEEIKKEEQEFETQQKKLEKIKELINENEEYKKSFQKEKKKKNKENKENKLEENQNENKKEKQKEKTREQEHKKHKLKWNMILGCCLLLICLLIGCFLMYQCFYLKEYGKKELLANGILLIPLFFASTACFTKGKWKKISTILGDITLILAILVTLAIKLGYIKLPQAEGLPDFTNKELKEVIEYAKKKNLSFEQTYEYSDNIEEYHIISQSVKAGTKLSEVKDFSVTVSYGPNYEKEIILPSMVGLKIDDALKAIKENFLNNVTINYILNEDTEKDLITSQSITGQMKRNAELVLEVSLGSAEDLVPVTLIDFKNMSLFDATLWLKRNGIPYELQYDFSENVKRNYVLSQSEKEGVTIDPKTGKVTLIVSKGKQIVVPNLLSMTIDEVISWISENNLKINFEDRYDTSIELGKMIEVSHQEGSIIEEGTTIKVVTSKGQLKMKEFSDINEFRTWATRYGITFTEEYEFHASIAKGEIIRFSVSAGDVININDAILVKISNGRAITIPNFIGSTKTSIQTQCSNLGLVCSFYYENSSKAKDTAISQNKKSGSSVVSGTNVRIGLSNGVTPSTPDLPPACDTSKGAYFYIAPGSNGSQVFAATKNQNPGFTINANYVDKCENGASTSGMVCNSSSYDEKWISYCTTITLTIVR